MTKVLLVDDHQMMVEGWISMIETTDDFEVVGILNSGKNVSKFLHKNKVDLIIMDVDMGSDEDDGIMATRTLMKQNQSGLKVLIVSMHNEMGHIQESMEAGANGYILKTDSSDDLLYAMRRIMSGEYYYSQEVMSQVAMKMRLAGQMKGIKLTKREKDALPLICKGFTAKKVGEILSISENTVNSFKKRIFIKFEVNKVSELINKARELGFVR